MRIVFVLTQSLGSPSGLGRYGPLAREMAKLGNQVQIIALHPNWNNLSQKRFSSDGVDVHYVSQMHVVKQGSHKTYYGPGKLMLISLLATARLSHALSKSQAEVIQLCKPQPFNSLAVRLAGKGRPVYCDCDDYEAETNRFTSNWQRHIVRYFEDSVINHVAGLTVNTQFSKQRYIDLGFPADRTIYVPNGVERSRFNITPNAAPLRRQLDLPSDAPVVAYVGTLGLQSHPVDLLLEAFAIVLRKLPKARLLLVGGGEDYNLLQQQAQTLDIAANTTFTGRVKPEMIPHHIALADVTVDPVYDDLIARARSPLKVLESLAMGVPVITGDVGDRSMLLAEGASGMLVPPGNSQALAEGMLTILQEAETRKNFSQEALAHREKWYWDELVNSFAQVYRL